MGTQEVQGVRRVARDVAVADEHRDVGRQPLGPESPLGLAAGDRVATLVSLTLTPLVIEDGLARWDGDSEQVP